MFTWPALELTEYERRFVRIYRTRIVKQQNGKNVVVEYPGVLNRRYKITLTSQALPDKNLPQIKLSDNIQIARRSRIYALTFSGNMDRWRLNIQNASGTQYTNKSPRGQLDPIVSSLVPGMNANALSLGGLTPPLTGTPSPGIGPQISGTLNGQTIAGQQPFPLLIEPNWLLMPNETLIFTGTPLDVTTNIFTEQTVTPPLTLTICAHVWEFPVMGTAPASERQVS